MNIAFSTEWFLTIPGILITCGVILLIIALIMFIVGSMKKKGNKEMPQSEEANVQMDTVMPVEGNNVNQTVESVPVTPVMDTVAVSEPMGPIAEVNNTPVVPEVTAVDLPQIEPTPVVNEVSAPAAQVPTIEVPEIVEPVQEVAPVQEVTEVPEVPVINTEAIPEVSEPVLETPDATNLEATSVNIYGGVVPTIEASSVQPVEGARPIYGGADPLEATQNLPRVDVHHEPYSGGTKPVEPVAPVIPEPIPEVVVPVETPVVAEEPKVATIPTPSVVEIPDVEQL